MERGPFFVVEAVTTVAEHLIEGNQLDLFTFGTIGRLVQNESSVSHACLHRLHRFEVYFIAGPSSNTGLPPKEDEGGTVPQRPSSSFRGPWMTRQAASGSPTSVGSFFSSAGGSAFVIQLRPSQMPIGPRSVETPTMAQRMLDWRGPSGGQYASSK